MKLFIVESPGKVKKIQDFLGAEWRVSASIGHFRMLPDKDYGLLPPDFKLHWVIDPNKKKKFAELKDLASKADMVYLASDPDREGEAIAYHLKEALGLTTYKRVTYTAITKEDVEAGIANCRDIDMQLVAAQEARRGLDRFVGWEVSGPLSRAVGENGMAAGRVQSPAVRIVVDRENEIKKFVSTTHYGVELIFDITDGVSDGWRATWLPKEGGFVDEANPYFQDKAKAEKIAAIRHLLVTSFEEKEAQTAPPAPFTTSSLQQAASNALKFSPKDTMALAQGLYEAGHITYMRTDSPNLSDSAIQEIRAFADSQGLPLPDTPRKWKSKDGAQEAHEAIRPTHIEIEEAGEDEKAKKLYALIRLRALASQLADATFAVRIARLEADFEDGKKVVFEAKGRTMISAGWRQLLKEGDATEEEENEPQNSVPELKEGAVVAMQGKVSEKKTKPKPRFKQATLIRELEKRGIGRPATYASILDKIITDKYLAEEKGYLLPTAKGISVVDVLTPVFGFMDLDFTKDMESKLDDVASGKLSYIDCISGFYNMVMQEVKVFKEKNVVGCPECGNKETFYHNVSKAKGKEYNYWKCASCNATFADDNNRPGMKQEKREQKLTEYTCPNCGKPLAEKPTKNGGIWFGCSGFPDCKTRFWEKDGKPDFENPPKN